MKCRAWLNFVDPEPEYKRHLKAKMKGTCGWIFENARFKAWLASGNDREYLWIKGNAGTFLRPCFVEQCVSYSHKTLTMRK